MRASVSLHGMNISYRESSGSGPVVVFVSGNSLSGACFHAQLDSPFGERFRLIALDLPGHGYSSRPRRPEETYTPKGYSTVLKAFSHALALDSPVWVGWSLGGNILFEAAAQGLASRGLFIFGTSAVQSMADFPNLFLPNEGMANIWRGNIAEDEAHAVFAALLGGGREEIARSLAADFMQTDGRCRETFFSALLRGEFHDQHKTVAELRVPLALALGSKDPLVNPRHLAALCAPTLWRGCVQVLDGLSHAPQIEIPERFNNLLEDFLRET